MYTFPFAVPELSAATDEELSALLPMIREHASTFSAIPASSDVVTALQACRDLAREVTAIISTRTEVAALSADIDGATAPIVPPTVIPDGTEDDTEDDIDPEPTTASARGRAPSVRNLRRRDTPELPPTVDDRPAITMHAAVDIPGQFSTGQRLDTFSNVVSAMAEQLDRYPTDRAGSRPTKGGPIRATSVEKGEDTPNHVLSMTRYTRNGVIQFRRDYPDALRADRGENVYSVASHASKERRLPGGSLLESYRRQVKAGRSITAAAGWCSPSETLYELCSLDSLDGILELPEIQASRGGFNIPTGGGPDFGTVWNGVGAAGGDTHLTEAEVMASTAKVCYDVPCDGFTDNRLGVDYVCLTGSLLQSRGFPEAVQWYTERALNVLPHKINMGVIAAIVAASGPATVIPADPSGDDAISSLLSGISLAIADAKYRNRMSFNGTLEVPLPMWVLEQLRAAGTRRNGVNMVGMSDQEIVDWFTMRKAIPKFVYDWQDAYSGLLTGPGGATPLTALPLTAQFLVYPAGTWVKAVQPVISLDTIYDSSNLVNNEYTAIFVEDGWAALQMCPLSRLYTVPVDPSGVIGCCPLS